MKTPVKFAPQPQLKNGVQKVGIVGGGQLARMLAQKAQQLGLQIYILSKDVKDPAAQVTQNWIQGDVNDIGTLKRFLEKVDVASFESEFLDAEKLKIASNFSKTPFFPAPEIMGILQDRKTQKELLEKHKISVAPWLFVEHEHQAQEVFETLVDEMILKKCRFGYDGYGTFRVRNSSDLKSIFDKLNPHGFIAEPKIKFRKELAFMIARDRNSSFMSFPLVETFQQDSKCLWVKGPVQHKAYKSLENQIKKLLNAIDYVGILGIELFDCGSKLVVNELAPRVHNSAHYSLDALDCDQFSAHLLAIAGYRFRKKTQVATEAFAMYNLIGQPWCPNWASNDLFYHWYGKAEVRAGRKMGHVNACAKTPELALQKIWNVKSRIAREQK